MTHVRAAPLALKPPVTGPFTDRTVLPHLFQLANLVVCKGEDSGNTTCEHLYQALRAPFSFLLQAMRSLTITKHPD
jgi:hypothetical protein